MREQRSASVPDAPRRLTGLAIIPVAFLIHNCEEAITVGRALPRLTTVWGSLLGQPFALPSAEQYVVALVVITVFAFGVLLLARLWDPASYALVVLQAVMTLNVFSHIAGAWLLGGYSPGLVTAILMEGPTSILVFRRLREARWMTRAQWQLLPLLAVLLHGPALVGLLWLVREAM